MNTRSNLHVMPMNLSLICCKGSFLCKALLTISTLNTSSFLLAHVSLTSQKTSLTKDFSYLSLAFTGQRKKTNITSPLILANKWILYSTSEENTSSYYKNGINGMKYM